MKESPPRPRLYRDLAAWWPLMSSPEEYAEESAIYLGRLAKACDGPIGSLLELGSGGGNNALHMKVRVDRLTLVDLSAEMVAISQALNPDCEHAVGDMRNVRLEQTFDAVFVHDAICYMLTEDDLRQAIRTAWVHCRPGGAVLLAPDYVREKFRAGEDCGGHDEPSGESEGATTRGMRFLEWVWDPDPEDNHYVVDYAYLLRHPDGSVTVEHDRHNEGLFPRDLWIGLLEEIGFEAVQGIPFEHSEVESGIHEVFVARRPR